VEEEHCGNRTVEENDKASFDALFFFQSIFTLLKKMNLNTHPIKTTSSVLAFFI
jgi:hypothetical protein